MNKNFIKLVGIAGVVSLMSVPMIAEPMREKIEALLDKEIVYTVDGEQVLEGFATITHADKHYVEVGALSDVLGYDVAVEEGKITLTEKPAVPESMMIERALIKEVDLEAGKVYVLPAGMEDHFMNYVILNVSEATTTVRHEFNRRAYRLQDLEEGTYVSVKHSLIMTMSLPPQTQAFEFVILSNQEGVVTPNGDATDDFLIGTLDDSMMR